ncbi:MAG: TIR domain-containing protein [Clostridiales bacterium]|nr:TIR domain-containing protein [Clostridiales bacterium]
MAIIKCKMCGGDLVIEPGSTVAECEYCGSRQTVPTADNEKKLTLFARANRLRSGCEFDKAAGVYESIVADFPEEAEAYWGLVLCKYGIEYVDDPATGKKIPTCHRSSFDSILEDSDFDQACENADVVARKVYREEAKQIEEIRKGIIEVSGREQPYDIFICYKETDENGQRTLDSVLAQDVYDALTAKDYRVFFSRITLEDKLGQEYEPYIFAALNSAKIMLAFGTDYEYFNAVWVKNEWSRYLKLMASDKSKHLIPCYKNIDAYDMPREFAKLQAQDMGKVGAIQDLLRGIEKLLPKKETLIQERVVVEAPAAGGKIASLLDRGYMALEDGDYDKADGFFEEVLNNDSKNAQAYIGKALMQQRQKTLDGLVRQWLQSTENAKPETLTLKPEEAHIEKAIQDYAIAGYLEPDDIRKEYDFDLSYPSTVASRQQQYQQTKARWENHQWLSKAEKFASGQTAQALEQAKKKLIDTLTQRLSDAKAEEEAEKKALWQRYEEFLNETDTKVEELYRRNLAQKEDDERRQEEEARQRKARQEEEARQREARYQELVSKLDTARTPDALGQLAVDFRKLSSYRDSAAHAKTCEERRNALLAREAAKEAAKRRKRNILIAACLVLIAAAVAVVKLIVIPALDYQNAMKLMEQGSYEEAITAFTAMGDYRDSEAQIQACEIGILDEGYTAAAALMAQGSYEEAITAFTALNGHRDSAAQIQTCKTIILDGKYDAAAALMAQGSYEEAITAFTALKGYRDSKEQIQACNYAIAESLLADGQNLQAAQAFYQLGDYRDAWQRCMELWGTITQRDTISAGSYHTVGLKANGTVMAVGDNDHSQCDVSNWTDIVTISAGSYNTVGLKADGTVVAVGHNEDGRCDVNDWKDIVAISAGDWHTVGLKADGTVVAVGWNKDGRCDVNDWKDIVAISAGYSHTVGLKADGTVVAVGSNKDLFDSSYTGQCDVSGWKDIVAISAGGSYTIGLKADGTVVAVGNNWFDQCDVGNWKDIVAISAGWGHTVGLKADGTVVAVGYNGYGQCDVGDWEDIVAISAEYDHTVGLKADGTVVAVGDNQHGQCSVGGWSDIKIPAKP